MVEKGEEKIHNVSENKTVTKVRNLKKKSKNIWNRFGSVKLVLKKTFNKKIN